MAGQITAQSRNDQAKAWLAHLSASATVVVTPSGLENSILPSGPSTSSFLPCPSFFTKTKQLLDWQSAVFVPLSTPPLSEVNCEVHTGVSTLGRDHHPWCFSFTGPMVTVSLPLAWSCHHCSHRWLRRGAVLTSEDRSIQDANHSPPCRPHQHSLSTKQKACLAYLSAWTIVTPF